MQIFQLIKSDIHAVAARTGEGKGGICHGRHFARDGILRDKNIEFWNLAALANWRLRCSQWYFTPHNNLLILPQFWDNAPNCQCFTTPHKAVCTPRNLHWWSDWTFTCCKTVEEDPYCPVTILLTMALQYFALFNLRVSKVCIKLGNSVWNLVILLSENL